jgi:hypothetical protein
LQTERRIGIRGPQQIRPRAGAPIIRLFFSDLPLEVLVWAD